MRALAVAVVSAAVLTACGTGGDDAPRAGAGVTSPATTAATTTPGATAAGNAAAADLAQVKAALRQTRAAKTATFVVEGRNELTQGTLTLRRTGSYDLGRGRASIVQTIKSDPPELIASLVGPEAAGLGTLEVRSVLTRKQAYLRLPARGKKPAEWVTFLQRDLDKAGRMAADLDASIFPPQLEMLAHANAATGPGDADPAVATVEVPAEHAFVAIPSSTPRKMIAAGLDPSALTGTVRVDVTIAGGLVKRVSFDPLDVFVEAAAELGQDGVGDQVKGLPSFIEVSRPGSPVRIDVPRNARRITPEDARK